LLRTGIRKRERNTLLQNCASHTKSVIYPTSLTPYSINEWIHQTLNGMTLIENQVCYSTSPPFILLPLPELPTPYAT
uniref:Uncharacterized protein n=1 Tax=Brugia timori TaxID=42155 RepID=A0A0R3QUU4_9BILA